ncbi:MAG: hypothetical protein HGB26_01510 [Desulfobulbaceae bacterium]|nr:hypothetical protein [Desulfobulbaceae bacterium]
MHTKKQIIVDRMKADGRLPKLWALSKGYKYTTVHAFLSGRVRPTSKSAVAITQDLIADGYLKEDEL